MTFAASVGKLISARPAPISGGCAENHLLWTVLSWGGSGLHGCHPLWTSKVAKAWFSEGSDSCRKRARNPRDLLRPRLGTGTLKRSHSSTGQKGTWLNPKSRARRNFKETSYIGSWCGLIHLFHKQANLKLWRILENGLQFLCLQMHALPPQLLWLLLPQQNLDTELASSLPLGPCGWLVLMLLHHQNPDICLSQWAVSPRPCPGWLLEVLVWHLPALPPLPLHHSQQPALMADLGKQHAPCLNSPSRGAGMSWQWAFCSIPFVAAYSKSGQCWRDLACRPQIEWPRVSWECCPKMQEIWNWPLRLQFQKLLEDNSNSRGRITRSQELVTSPGSHQLCLELSWNLRSFIQQELIRCILFINTVLDRDNAKMS